MKLLKYIAIFLCICCNSQHITSKNSKEHNSFTFSNDQLFQKNSIKLDTNWAFYWKKYIHPKEFKEQQPLDFVKLTSWTNYKDKNKHNLPPFGYATYKINFNVPKERPNISLYIPRIIGAYKIWINGVYILETGRIGTSKETTLHRRFTKIIPLDSDKTNFEVVIQVANFYNKKAGITEPILLGITDKLFYKKSLQIMADMISVGSFLFIGILFLIFFLLYWNKDKAVLYFSLMCIALSYHTLNDRYAPLSKIFKDIDWIFLTKLEYIASYVVGYCASMFFIIILEDFIHKWYRKIVLYCTAVLSISVIVLPAPHFTRAIEVFLLLMVINIVYIFAITIKAIIAKTKASLLLLIGIIFGSIVFLANIIFFINEDEIALIYVKFGYILVFLFIAMLLLRRFSNSFHKLELANSLALAQKKEISTQSKELSNINLQLKENLQLLQSNNEELEDFNHIVSHDLKTPLVSVYSLVAFLEEDLKDKLDEHTESHITMMKDVISKMEMSINGLLAYSKIAKGSKHKEWFDFNETLTKVITLIDQQNKSIVNLPRKDVKIYANKLELEHVFQNLIGNSIKYNDKEKAIIDIDVVIKNNEYLFSVSDNGPGIEPQYHDKIFKIFSQLQTNEKDTNSTGIGLAIVKKIIANNNGLIKVSSEVGNGLTISFTWQIPSEN